MSNKSLEEEILGQKHFAVLGASRDRDKYGYKVYRKIKAAGYTVYAINPNADEIDGDPCYPSLDNAPTQIDCLVTVTPPQVTETPCIWRAVCESPTSGCSPALSPTPRTTPRKASEFKLFPAGRASCRKSRRGRGGSKACPHPLSGKQGRGVNAIIFLIFSNLGEGENSCSPPLLAGEGLGAEQVSLLKPIQILAGQRVIRVYMQRFL